MANKCIIFSAPSGAGKTTIVNGLLEKNLNLEFSISACSRPKRPDESDSKDYYFLTVEEFKQKIDANEFLEWEEVYKNNFYGTLKSETERIWSEGKDIIFDLDVIGGINLKKFFGDKALAIFVMAPSIKTLSDRLTGRKTETPESLQRRIEKAEYEMRYAPHFDKILVNNNLESALQEAETMVRTFLNNE